MMNEKFVLFEDLGIQKGRNLLSVLTVMIPHVCVCSHPDGGPGYCSDCVWLPSLHLSAQVSRLPIQVHVLAGSIQMLHVYAFVTL